MTRQRWWITVLLLVITGTLAVMSTYTYLSPTVDENTHFNAGLEWVRKGTYTVDLRHPPLARIAIALPFLIIGDKLPDEIAADGHTIDTIQRENYRIKSWLMRLGNLPFYILSCLLLAIWARRLFGEVAALWSLALYVSLATVSAHAGLATTDMSYTALFLLTLMAAIDWIKHPSAARSAIMGICAGLMAGVKFSALVQFPAAMACVLLACLWDTHQRLPVRRRHIGMAVVVALPLFVLTQAVLYNFSFHLFTQCLWAITEYNHQGISVWLFKKLPMTGVWYFFPVVFFFKTPLPFQMLSALGSMPLIRRFNDKNGSPERLFPLLAAMGVLAVSMTSNINLGVRHVLPLYPLLAIPAGYAMHELWQGGRWRRALAISALIWQVAGFTQAWPDFISYFNLLAGEHPEHITLESDFDWEQGLIQLDQAVQARHIQELYVCAHGAKITPTNLKMLVHAHVLDCPTQPVRGWIAMSRALMVVFAADFAWLHGIEPVQSIGRTMVLYYIPAP